MRIGYDAKRAFHNFRGLGNYSRDLLAGMSKYYPKEDYFLFTPPFKDDRAVKWGHEYENFKIITPQKTLHKTFSSAWRSLFLVDEISKLDLDIYHGLSHELPNGIENLGIKKVVTIHDLIFLRMPEHFNWLDRQVYLRKVRYACEVADVIVAICEQTKSDLIELLQVPSEKIEVIYQTCNPRFYTPATDQKIETISKRYNLPEKFILSVGAIEERKNLMGVVRAFNQIRGQVNHDLVVVGQGKEYKQQVQEYVNNNNLNSGVHFLTDVTHTDLPIIYQLADLFCYPSFYEGFGIPIIEALFSKTPVLTSEGGVFPEAAGPHSLYINPHSVDEISSGMLKVLQDDEFSYAMREHGRNFVEKFHRSKTSEQMYQLYQRLV
jgi:glycosyltransferase involved in cell wall biosynthesis